MAEVTVSIPDDLLEEIDAEAKLRATDRSTVVMLAVRDGLHRDRAAMDAAIARGEELFRDAGPFESGELIRAERDRRELRDLQR
jgi:hypothetical protein